MNTPISPGFTSYAVQTNHRYRMMGRARGAEKGATDVADADVINALVLLGFSDLVYYPTGADMPSDWPTENQIQISEDERTFHAEGTWTKGSTLPTATDVKKNGSAIIYQLWDYVREAASASAGNTGIIRASTGSSALATVPTDKALLVSGLVFVGVGLFAAVAAWRNRGHMRANPIRYDTTVEYKGIPVHVHREDIDGRMTFCADYRAASPSDEGVACAADRGDAVDEAKRRIDALTVRKNPKRRKRKARR